MTYAAKCDLRRMQPSVWETAVRFRPMSSSPFLGYLCGNITAPHTGLACILQCFESVSVVLRVRRYFLRQCRVYGIFFIEWGKKDQIGKALASCGWALSLVFQFALFLWSVHCHGYWFDFVILFRCVLLVSSFACVFKSRSLSVLYGPVLYINIQCMDVFSLCGLLTFWIY